MKRLTILFLSLSFLSCSQLMSPQSKSITKKYFPELEIEINTPAFEKKKGFTTHEELLTFVNKLQSGHPDIVSIQYIGSSQKGKQIPMVLFHKNKLSESNSKVWIQGGLHGNEPASTEGVLYLMDRLLNDNQYTYLLDDLHLAFVPMANIDGYEKHDRYAANGLDLNRDQTKLMAPESVVLKQAFSDFGAEVALDFHEYRSYRKDLSQLRDYGVAARYDVMFLYSGNLNVPENIRSYTQQVFVKNAIDMLVANGLKTHDYVTPVKIFGDLHFNQGSSNARSSATSYALTNSVSSLIEVRGVGLGRTSFKRRVNAAFLVGLSYLQTTVANQADLKAEIRSAIEAQQVATVISKKKRVNQTIEVIDLDTEEEVSLDIIVHDALQSTPELQRTRPTAYVILATEVMLIEKLKVLGQKLEELTEEKSIEIEKYIVTEYAKDAAKYEGVHRQNVKTVIKNSSKVFPKGTYLLYLDQPKANLAIEVLEPEADNSFVSFNVLHTNEGEELPIYRYLLNKKL